MRLIRKFAQLFAFVLALGVVLLTLTVVAAVAQSSNCAPYPDLTAHLISQFGETMVWHGDATPEAVVQLWSNAETQTWTVVAYRADGTGCFMASGTGFETFAPPPAGTEG